MKLAEATNFNQILRFLSWCVLDLILYLLYSPSARSPSGAQLVFNDDSHQLIVSEFINNTIIIKNVIKCSTPILCSRIHSINYYNWELLPIFISSRHKPIQLLDGYTNKTHSHYPIVDKDEFATPFDLYEYNNSLIASHNSSITFFNINDPNTQEEVKLSPTKASKNTQHGIISSIDINSTYLACASLSRSLGIYSLLNYQLELLLTHLPQSVIQLKWINDNLIALNFRNHDYILIYDVNDLSEPVNSLHRLGSTNQNIYFHIKDNWLSVGDTNGQVLFYDLGSLSLDGSIIQPTHSFAVANDVVSCVAFHPFVNMLAVSSGSRHIGEDSDSEDSEDDTQSIKSDDQVEKVLSEEKFASQLMLFHVDFLYS